jgi:chromate reductase
MKKYTVGIIVGSLRKQSFSMHIAKYIAGALPEDMEPIFVSIGALEMFNQDFDDEGITPASWEKFREQIEATDGFLFVTPEYNRSFPAVIKNALDVASRPYGRNVWDGKPAGIVSVSPGPIGGSLANNHLRQPMMFLNIRLMTDPEQYVANAAAILDENGNVTDEHKKSSFAQYAEALGDWIRHS